MNKVVGMLPQRLQSALLQKLPELHWRDGSTTALGAAAVVKRCEVADFGAGEKAFYDQAGAELVAEVTSYICNVPEFIEQALPSRLGAMRFIRYPAGGEYGEHVDEAMSTGFRADLSFTVMLQPALSGGVFWLDGYPRGQEVGSISVYSSSLVHRVSPVVEGERIVLVGWVQSMVRDHHKRALLADVQRMIDLPRETQAVRLRALRNELLRRWGG